MNSTQSDDYVVPASTTVWLVFNILLGVVGLAGNSAVCLTVYHNRLFHDITYYLIVSLAMSDFLCCLFFICSVLFVADGHFVRIDNPTGALGEIYCRLFWSLHLFWSSFFASVFSLVVLTFERFLAVVHPGTYTRLFTVRKGLVLAVVAWVLGYVLEIEFPINIYADGENGCAFPGLGPVWFGKLMFMKSFVISFVLPLIFLVIAYYKIIRTLRREAASQQPQEDASHQPQEVESQQPKEAVAAGQKGAAMRRVSRGVIQSLIIITTLFVILLLPSELGNVMLFFEVPVDARSGVWEVFRTLTVFNSVVNPMIYAMRLKIFRRAMKVTLCPCIKRSEQTDDNSNTMTAYTLELQTVDPYPPF